MATDNYLSFQSGALPYVWKCWGPSENASALHALYLRGEMISLVSRDFHSGSQAGFLSEVTSLRLEIHSGRENLLTYWFPVSGLGLHKVQKNLLLVQ